jgi:hypothetical protein
MLKQLRNVVISTLLLTSTNILACDIDGKTGIMPDNDMWIGTNQKSLNGMTEEVFNHVIDRAIEHYEPLIAEKGKKLKVFRKWEDGTVNAYARQMGSTWEVHMFGGLARHEAVSADGFALVLCHELGHHLAGAPKTTRFFAKTWASNEGQSDYWASMKCFRRIYGQDDNVAIVSAMEIDEVVTEKCEKIWESAEDRALCKRSSQASKGLATLLNGNRPVSFKTPDTSVVSRTNHKHPAGQCRLDTYFAGALCTKDIHDEVSNRDQTAGVCNRFEGFEDGVRSQCWFKPNRI